MRTGSNVGPTLSLYGVGIYQIGSPFPHVRQDVSVAAQRHGRIRMTEYIRHGPNVHPAPDHEGAGGVAQIGEADPRNTGSLAVVLEGLVEGGAAGDNVLGVREEYVCFEDDNAETQPRQNPVWLL